MGVEESVNIILGEENVTDEVVTFTAPGYFSSTISFEFTTEHTSSKFAVDAEIEYMETSVLDYMPFDASIDFYGTSTHDTTQTEFRLGDTVYSVIRAAPLVAVPLSDIALLSCTVTQTDDSGVETTNDILGEEHFGYSGSYQSSTSDFQLQFTLDASHFTTTVEGHPSIVSAEIEVSYQDGTVVRRQLRRNLVGEQNNDNVTGEITILPEESALGVAFEKMKTYGSKIHSPAFVFALTAGVAFTYYKFRDSKKEDVYSELLEVEL